MSYYEYYEYCQNIWDGTIDYMYTIDWSTILFYLAMFIALYFAFTLEYKDLYCPEDGQTCKLGNCNAFIQGKPKPNDDISTLLEKIRISARYDECSVYWRRSLIFSILLTLILLILVLQRLPIAYELLTSFAIIYLFTYMFLVFYQENISKPAVQQVVDGTHLISKEFY